MSRCPSERAILDRMAVQRGVVAVGLAVALATGCGGGGGGGDDDDHAPGDDTGDEPDAAPEPELPDADPACAGEPPPTRELVTDELEDPIFVTAPTGDPRLFAIEQLRARIRIIAGGELLAEPFLDLGGVAGDVGERGLLGLAFHPDYAANGRFFVTYTRATDDDLVIAEYAVSGDPDVADPTELGELVRVGEADPSHYGGQIGFGPDDMLYAGIGDMDDNGNPTGSAQDLGLLTGKMLRIDVGAEPGDYSAPADNPFVGTKGARAEVWAYGLRVPWRWSFDRATDDLYIADVGEGSREEIDFRAAGAPAGANFGWPVREGTDCIAEPCEGDFTDPVAEYPHEGTCAIIGGSVYRGDALPCLRGRYFYSDYCGAWVRSLVVVDGQAAGQQEHGGLSGGIPVSLGEDAAGELYVIDRLSGLFRVAPGR
jgi:glucose/arabinose dehydrogenase